MSQLKFNQLNAQQKKAVTFGEGPLLIVAGAGTGKTAVLTHRLAYLIREGKAEPNQILGLTFTDKAAGEMEQRVDRLLPLGYLDLWVSTFHSFCQRILERHGLDIGLPGNFQLIDRTQAWLQVRKNLEDFDLDYYQPRGNPTSFIYALVSHFARCKDQLIYPEDYLEYSKKVEQDQERITEVARAYQTYQDLLLENQVLDFGDLINYTLELFQERPLILEKYQDQFKYTLVDEFQDTNWAQYQLVKLIAQPENNLSVASDDDQCLPGSSLIATKDGEKQIKDIEQGDKVLTAVGRGHVGISKVNKVFQTKKKRKILKIETESGFKVKVTDNHKMFSYLPAKSEGEYHYVYLMKKEGLGWRMGITNDLVVRLRLERSADKIIAIRAFDTEEEARYHETLWSLKYGIPTICFKLRKGLAFNEELTEKLYEELDLEKRVRRLARDLNIDLDSHHFCLDAVNRGSSLRIKINLEMCYRKYRSKHHVKRGKELLLNPKIEHKLTLQTSDQETLRKLEESGFKMTQAKKGKHLRVYSSDLKSLGKKARTLEKITGGIIEPKFRVGVFHQGETGRVRTYEATIIPAKNLVRGCFLPVKKGNEIVYDKVERISEEEKEITVYDLEIDETHNFIANGIVVHNSIYKFRGACFGNINQFNQDFPEAEKMVLVKNYRSSQQILDLSYDLIQGNNPHRLEHLQDIDKKLEAAKEIQPLIEHLHFRTKEQEVLGVVNKIIELKNQNPQLNFNDFAILVRANRYAKPFSRALERAGLPYQFRASRGLYSKPIILDLISYFKLLDNYHQNSALFRVLKLPFLELSAADLSKITTYSNKKAQSLYQTLNQINKVPDLSGKTRDQVSQILGWIKDHTQLASQRNTSEVMVRFLEDSGYLEYLVEKESQKELEFLNQFYNKIKSFEEQSLDSTLHAFVEQLEMELESGAQGELNYDLEQGPQAVNIMTLHSAKGLEFKYVFLVNLVNRRFPTDNRSEPIQIPEPLIKDTVPEGNLHLQEERRLFYVGMTRAEKGLFFTSAEDYGGSRKKKLSRFLKELGFDQTQPISATDAPSNLDSSPEPVPKVESELSLPPYFSFTQLRAFDNCPLQYKFAHILKVPIQGKAVFSFGKTIHNTLAGFVRTFLEKGAGVEDLLEIYQEQWIEDWFENSKQKQQYFEQGKQNLKNFYQEFVDQEPSILYLNNEPALEQNFKLKIGGETLIGKIDRIDRVGEDQVELIDYKTGESKDSLRKSDKEQLLIYQIATEQVLGLEPQSLTYYYINGGKKLSFLGNLQQKQEMKETIVSRMEKIKQKRFPPTPGWQCKWCDFKNICPHASR